MKTTTLNHKNYSAFQTYALLDFNINFENDVPSDDIARTVIKITERMNIGKYVDLSSRRLHGHDAMKLLRLLERKTRTDIRYRFLTGNESIGHSSFQRFMQNDLLEPFENIFYELNDMIAHDDRIDIAVDILIIDGSKFEANPKKNTFVDASLDMPVGRELMTARQVFSEGAFGIIKQDYGYDRLRRRGNSNVSFEIFMVAIGFNIRKYHNMIRKRKPSEESMKCC